MVFYGDQNAGIINNVAGDQHNTGGQYGTVVSAQEARRAVRELRDNVMATQLDVSTAREARARLSEIDTAMNAPEPDQSRVARVLKRLTQLLITAGSLSAASTALIAPLQTLAHWLGMLGEPILRMLPALG
jgi:hypothetical protein